MAHDAVAAASCRTAAEPAPARSRPDPPGWPRLLSLGWVSHLALPCGLSGRLPPRRQCATGGPFSDPGCSWQILPPGDPVDKISDQYWKIRAEEVPEEERQAGPQDRLLHVYHFRRDKLNKDQVSPHPTPPLPPRCGPLGMAKSPTSWHVLAAFSFLLLFNSLRPSCCQGRLFLDRKTAQIAGWPGLLVAGAG
jgi:hypothetical protein